MDFEKVLLVFGLFSDIAADEIEKWSNLCRSAAVSLENRLKKSTNVNKEMERLCIAAAAYAYADYLLITGNVLDSSQIKVGDITIGNSSGTKGNTDSSNIRKYFEQQIADLIEPNDFAFRSFGGDGPEK